MTPTADIETRRRILEAMLPFVTDEDRMVLCADSLFEGGEDPDGLPCRACLMGWEWKMAGRHANDIWAVDLDIVAACATLGIEGGEGPETEATRQGRAADVVREALRALA